MKRDTPTVLAVVASKVPQPARDNKSNVLPKASSL
jgi:hypothetical protein